MHPRRRSEVLADVPPEWIKFETPKYDPRYPNQDQTRNCYHHFIDFHRCVKVRGPEFEACKYFKKVYQVYCPSAWVEHWDEQLAEGTFPYKF